MPDAICPVKGCGFRSLGHPTKKSARARMAEHVEEHETRKPMREVAEFNKENGLTEVSG